MKGSFRLILALIVLGMLASGASASTATLVSVPSYIVDHPNLTRPVYAGLFTISLNGSSYDVYCLELTVLTSIGESYRIGGGQPDPEVLWILYNSYPNTAAPEGLTDQEKAAAVQIAIWHFTDDLDISSGGEPENVFDAAREIIAAAGSMNPDLRVPFSLTLQPSSSTNLIGTSHTLDAILEDQMGNPLEGRTVSFSVTGANEATGSDVTDSEGRAVFSYSGSSAGNDTAIARIDFDLPMGVVWVGAAGTIQELVMAETGQDFLTARASKAYSRGNLTLKKTASSSSVAPGGRVTYTLTYTNYGSVPVDGVVVTESYPTGMVFVSASPPPDAGTNNRWTIGTLEPGESGTITVTVYIPPEPDIRFSFEQKAAGKGFLRVHKDVCTSRRPVRLTNVATISGRGLGPFTATSHVSVKGDSGTSMSIRESGSGNYSGEEVLIYRRESRSIFESSNVSARYSPESFELPGGRLINQSALWVEKERAKNYETGESFHDEYTHATRIDRESVSYLGRNATGRSVEAEFEGTRESGYIKESAPDQKGHRAVLKESDSLYTGSFSIRERIGSIYTNRSTAITYVRMYDEPHITVYQRGHLDATDSSNLNLTVSVLNDGNRALGPIYVRDVFPAGTGYFDASIRPSDPSSWKLASSSYANWTITYLPAGGSATIYLRLRIDQVIGVPVNCVYAAGGYDGMWATNSSCAAFNVDWLSCSPGGICAIPAGSWHPPDWGYAGGDEYCAPCDEPEVYETV